MLKFVTFCFPEVVDKRFDKLLSLAPGHATTATTNKGNIMTTNLPNSVYDTHLLKALSSLQDAGTPATFKERYPTYVPVGEGEYKVKPRTMGRLVENGWVALQEDGTVLVTEKGLADAKTTDNLLLFRKEGPEYLQFVTLGNGKQEVYCRQCSETGMQVWSSGSDDDFKSGAIAAAEHFVSVHHKA